MVFDVISGMKRPKKGKRKDPTEREARWFNAGIRYAKASRLKYFPRIVAFLHTHEFAYPQEFQDTLGMNPRMVTETLVKLRSPAFGGIVSFANLDDPSPRLKEFLRSVGRRQGGGLRYNMTLYKLNPKLPKYIIDKARNQVTDAQLALIKAHVRASFGRTKAKKKDIVNWLKVENEIAQASTRKEKIEILIQAKLANRADAVMWTKLNDLSLRLGVQKEFRSELSRRQEARIA